MMTVVQQKTTREESPDPLPAEEKDAMGARKRSSYGYVE
jgi:hypothetical protein